MGSDAVLPVITRFAFASTKHPTVSYSVSVGATGGVGVGSAVGAGFRPTVGAGVMSIVGTGAVLVVGAGITVAFTIYKGQNNDGER